jgi:hypothetical protein
MLEKLRRTMEKMKMIDQVGRRQKERRMLQQRFLTQTVETPRQASRRAQQEKKMSQVVTVSLTKVALSSSSLKPYQISAFLKLIEKKSIMQPAIRAITEQPDT